ncbi:aldehyde dehydrogenase family protein [Streptomyces qinglanensis]|uniref:aldehyde dehydrogenase family protein n=1 Tax=Streptomyces qinglanensis TaxID=943816 RepID=UPI0037ADBA62
MNPGPRFGDRVARELLGPSLARVLAEAGVDSTCGALLPVPGVFSGRALISVPVGGPEAVPAAVARAEEASGAWGTCPARRRLGWVARFGRAVAERRAALTAVLPQSSGLGPEDARIEYEDASRTVRACARAAFLRPRAAPGKPHGAPLRPADRPAVVFSGVDEARPLASLLEGALPALLSGIAVVTCLDRRSAVPALAAVAAARGAGLPRHVWQLLVHGPDREDGVVLRSVLAEHTQGPALQCCRHPLPRQGRAPGLLVLRRDGNVRAAARGALAACFGRAGRRCSATPVVAVDRGLVPAFLADLGMRLISFEPAAALPEPGQEERLLSWARGLAEDGGRVLWRGPPGGTGHACTPQPLVLLAPEHARAVPPGPPPGPVAVVVPFSSWADALGLMRHGGPHLSVYTRASPRRLWPQFAGLPAARISLNRPPEAGLPPALSLDALRSA